ncbi:carbohydrate porin [Vibrio vulnificus]|uniref:carbohydrate porin n=1 Tax=Vibrio vulnificus TaxID=672 RepID=UPI001CDCD679|nr:carbohydrate porin [Vibrio vulnificus]
MVNQIHFIKSKLALGVVIGLAFASQTHAAEMSSIEFHGYFRAGVISSVENDLKRSNFAGQKETLGRLGIEADNDYKANLVSNWDFDDGRNFRINFGVGAKGKEAGLSSSADGFDAAITNAFVELKGVSPTGTFWAGKREYGKSNNYIFMTDFFYTDMSGIGIGLTDLSLFGNEFDLAYIASDRYDENTDRWEDSPAQVGNNATNLNNLLHAIHIGTSFDNLAVSALLKAMPDNWDTQGKEWAETGFDLTLTYKMSSFFGLSGNGFSNIIAQAGKGLGAGNLLGGTITDYNAYAPGSLAQGQHDDWGAAGDARQLLSKVEDDDTSARLMLWGGYTFDNGVGFFPSIQGQYNHMASGDARSQSDYNYWLSAMTRMTVPVSSHFYVQGEVGYAYNNWGGSSWNQSKLTIAPTFILPTSVGVNPEIRLLASYLPKSWTNLNEVSGKPEDDFIVGFQADLWW